MAIPTLKNKHICQVLGTGIATILEDMLVAGRSTYAIAGAMGIGTARMQQLLSGPDPLPEKPMNWAGFASGSTGPAGTPWAGLGTIAWTGIDGGFTWGPPLFYGCVYTTAAYPAQSPASPPINWTGSPGVGPGGTAWAGVATIAYSVPWEASSTHLGPGWNPAAPGYTYGTPVYP